MAKKLKQTFYGGNPSADLLPARQRAERAHERAMPKLLLAVVISALVAGLLYVGGSLLVTVTNDRLAQAENESAALYEELASHAETQKFTENTELIDAQINSFATTEVHFSSQFAKVRAVLPEEVTLTVFTAFLAEGAELDETQLCEPGYAMATLEVMAPSLTSTAELIGALQQMESVQCAEALDVVEETQGQSRFTLQMVLDETAGVERFADGSAS